MRSIFHCVVALTLAATTLQAQTAGHEARIARIEQSIRPAPIVRGNATTIEERMKALRVPGISVAVVDSGVVIWAKGYGVADTASKRAVTANTRFQAASMSKPVGSMAALRLVQEGKLSLDADINTLLRSWKLPPSGRAEWKPVTLRMLLTHTGGLTVHGFSGYELEAATDCAADSRRRQPRQRWQGTHRYGARNDLALLGWRYDGRAASHGGRER